MFEWKKNAADPHIKFHCRASVNTVIDYEELKQWGLDLPSGNRHDVDKKTPVFWLSPNEWLVINPTKNLNHFSQALCRLIPGMVVTDLSDTYDSIELVAQEPNNLLPEGLGVSWALDGLGQGDYARARCLDLPVIVYREDSMRFRLYFDRSMNGYVGAWLEAVAS